MPRPRRSARSPGLDTPPDPLDRNRAYYTRHRAGYEAMVLGGGHEATYEAFSRLVGARGRILDVGCGCGDAAVAFAKLGHSVDAFDATPAMVERSRSRGVNARLCRVERYSGRARYRGIWAAGCLLHVPRSRIPGVLRRLERAMAPGAVLYASLWEGHGEGIVDDGRFVSRYYASEFRAIVESLPHLRVLKSWREAASGGQGGIRWIHVLCTR